MLKAHSFRCRLSTVKLGQNGGWLFCVNNDKENKIPFYSPMCTLYELRNKTLQVPLVRSPSTLSFPSPPLSPLWCTGVIFRERALSISCFRRVNLSSSSLSNCVEQGICHQSTQKRSYYIQETEYFPYVAVINVAIVEELINLFCSTT